MDCRLTASQLLPIHPAHSARIHYSSSPMKKDKILKEWIGYSLDIMRLQDRPPPIERGPPLSLQGVSLIPQLRHHFVSFLGRFWPVRYQVYIIRAGSHSSSEKLRYVYIS
jgi:hypothetical protein